MTGCGRARKSRGATADEQAVRGQPDVWFLASAAAATAVFLALPEGTSADALAIAITGSCVPAFYWGVARGRPSQPVMWRFLGAATR